MSGLITIIVREFINDYFCVENVSSWMIDGNVIAS